MHPLVFTHYKVLCVFVYSLVVALVNNSFEVTWLGCVASSIWVLNSMLCFMAV